MRESFYEPLGGGRYRSTPHTAGPWTTEHQHMGPPSALLTRHMLALPGLDGSLTRVTSEILGPLPITDIEVTATVERSGRSVELLSAELRAEDRVVVRARAWRVIASDTTPVATSDGTPLAPPSTGEHHPRQEGWGPGYLDVTEWWSLKGAIGAFGPATMWGRQHVDLVAGETPGPLERLLVIADSGNGISNLLDPREWHFINTELTVHIHREPQGEWIGIDAHTVLGDHGAGSAFSVLHDEHGPVGRGAQALLVRPRR